MGREAARRVPCHGRRTPGLHAEAAEGTQDPALRALAPAVLCLKGRTAWSWSKQSKARRAALNTAGEARSSSITSITALRSQGRSAPSAPIQCAHDY